MTFGEWLCRRYEEAIVYLPGWPDAAIMDCDLGRLDLAIQASARAKEAEQRFRLRLHGFKLPDERPPPRNAAEQHDWITSTFQGLGTVKVTRGG